MESLEIDGDKEGTDSTKCTQKPMGYQLRGVRVLRKIAPCTFSWALSQRKNLLIQAVMSWITSWKCLLLILTPMSWNGKKKTNAERLPTLSRVARQLLYILATSVPSERYWYFHFRKYCHKEGTDVARMYNSCLATLDRVGSLSAFVFFLPFQDIGVRIKRRHFQEVIQLITACINRFFLWESAQEKVHGAIFLPFG